jgi:N utilization substance protein B
MEDVVAQHQRAAVTADERAADDEGLGQALGTRLHRVREAHAELLARADVPTGAAISEYVDVAHAFFEEREAKFVNGLLDAVAKEVR